MSVLSIVVSVEHRLTPHCWETLGHLKRYSLQPCKTETILLTKICCLLNLKETEELAEQIQATPRSHTPLSLYGASSPDSPEGLAW